MLHVLTFRPEFVPPWPPRSHITPLTLNRLERPQVEALVRQRDRRQGAAGGGGAADCDQDRWGAAVCRRADQDGPGVRARAGGEGRYEPDRPLADVGDSLHAAGFPDGAPGSAADRRKRWPNWGRPWGGSLRMSCSRPCRRWTKPPYRRGWRSWWRRSCSISGGGRHSATYLFKHALIQDTAYQSLLKSTRQQYHQQIAQVLEAAVPRDRRDAARAGGASLHRGGAHRAGHSLLAAGWAAGASALGQCGSGPAPDQRAGAAGDAARDPNRESSRSWTCSLPWGRR